MVDNIFNAVGQGAPVEQEAQMLMQADPMQEGIPFNEDEMSLEEATPEEEQLLIATVDSIEEIIHGKMRDKIVDMLDSTPHLHESISQAASNILLRVSHKLDEQQIENDGSIFFGINGAVQQTVELLWEVAEAMQHPATRDPDNLQAAYLATMAVLGETMVDDEESAREAEAFLIDLELGDGTVDRAAEELEMMATQASPGGEDLYMNAPPLARGRE